MKASNTLVSARICCATILFCLLSFSPLFSQTNVRAWYADGQVWVVWQASFPLPDWYAVYAKPTTFNDVANATLIGRPHKFEYGCAALKEQVDTTATVRIPGPTGAGKYQLALDEALFVFTPHQAGSLYFAVVAEGQTAVTAGQNITAAAVPFQYDPAGDPVECHLQTLFPSPFAAGFNCAAFMMWADGRQNQWENRPDFPVMANAAKNGMPSLFFISVPAGLDTTQPFALSVWLHGGGGTARQSLAGSRIEIDIKPEDGVLLAHDDNLIGWRDQVQPLPDMPTWHFGWRKNYDPFTPGNLPTAVDTIVNYTQRRYLWIDDWLIKHFNIDPNRIHIHGHSMGSSGATALVKCYPEHYASLTIFNNGFGGPEATSNVAVLGEPTLNFPTNLKNRFGETVRLLNLWNLLDNCASARDWPPIRHWHSKNDDNGTMQWDAYVVENYRKADSLGIGVQNMWSERNHGVDTGPAYNDHWVSGTPANQQTMLDNVAFAESRFRSDASFPAFFNHRLDPQNNDPGTGLIGINNGDGDNWGAWGGWHRWSDTEENTVGWRVDAWLESAAVFANDNCPADALKADVAIRRPQTFKPQTGQTLQWEVLDAATLAKLQSGSTVVQADNLVVIPQVEVFRENIRRVRIRVFDPATSVGDPAGDADLVRVFPNPASETVFFNVPFSRIRIFATGGILVLENQRAGETGLDISGLPAGLYLLEHVDEKGERRSQRLLKI
jgi:hypothetical protein